KGHVGIKVADQVVLLMDDSSPSRIERVNLAGEVALLPLRHSHQLDPGMSRHVPLDDLVGAVRRPITDDHPLARRNRWDANCRNGRLKLGFSFRAGGKETEGL